jgi:hypothetical protein
MTSSEITPDKNVSSDAKFEALVAHYDNTFDNILVIQKRRDRLFLWTVVFAVLLLFHLAAPDEIDAALAEIVRTRLGLEGEPNVTVLGSVVWFAILGFVVRYFQTVVHNERYLTYLHKLEERLSLYYDGLPFTREGKYYLTPYPYFSKWTWFLYTILFPILLLLVASTKIVVEIRAGINIVVFFNAVIFLAILISSVLYIVLLHLKR